MAEPLRPWDPSEPQDEPPRRPFLAWLFLLALIALGVFVLMRLFPGRIATAEDAGWLGRSVLWAAVAAAIALSFRGRLKQAARYAAGWLAVVGVLALGYAYRGELKEAALRVRAELIPGYAVSGAPRELMVAVGPDGHFTVVGQVNGQPVLFMVDTGASAIVLSPGDARRLGVDMDGLSYDQPTETANGVGRSAGWRADRVDVGELALRDVEMQINQAPMSVSLLGMDFFRRLESYRVENGRLYMRWRE
jgi:aspartyl protease family protein